MTGIRDERCSGVADKSYRFAGLQAFDQFGGARCLVVFVIADERLMDLESYQQLLGLTGVFAVYSGDVLAQFTMGSQSIFL
jgi:hypothetical protein